MKKLAFTALIAPALLGALAASSPASAQSWNNQQNDHREHSGWQAPARNADIRQDINQLRFDIDRARQRGTISRREADSLRREAQAIQRQYATFARHGLDRRETATLRNRVSAVRSHLISERRDRDGHRN